MGNRAKKRKTRSPMLMCRWKECRIKCNDAVALDAHIEEHLINDIAPKESKDKMYKCTWSNCEFTTKDEKKIERHLYYHGYYTCLMTHGKCELQRNPDIPSCKASKGYKIPELDHDFTCEWLHCEWTFTSIVKFHSHIEQHANFEYEISKTPEIKKPTFFECNWNFCKKSFDYKYRYLEHLQSHSNKKAMACPHCGDTFRTRTTLFDHLRRQPENNTERYQCAQCLKLFATEKFLRAHVIMHVNCYKCSLCDMTCTTQSALATHIRYRHLKDRPYFCPECDQRFVRQCDLVRHTEYLHLKKVYRCEERGCSYSVRTYNLLRRHYLEVHGDSPFIYLCHCCDKAFKSGRSLSCHLIKIHNFQLPSGHKRFSYRVDENGFYRLETTRIESLEVTKQILSPNPESTDMTTQDSSCYEIVSMTNNNTNNDARIIVSNDPIEAHLVGEVIISLPERDTD